MAYEDILEEVRVRYGVDYSPNYLIAIISTEIPKRIALVAAMKRLEDDSGPTDRKACIHCGRILPKHPLFFSRNNSHKDGLSNTCK